LKRARAALVGFALAGAGLANAFQPGDLNCDGTLNGYDIDPFVLALTDPAVYAQQFPTCDYMLADLDGDGSVDGYDIDPFVLVLTGGSPYEPPTAVELAGNSLTAYPYFEYVRAFNQNAPIKLALDPALHPEINGATADVYVVEKKTAGHWYIDPSLADVTVGGPLTVTFSGGTVQDNIFEITGPDELNAAAFEEVTGDFTGLGHGYDMIVDMDRNGQLDAGDYIDGLGREAGLYVVHDTTQAGPLAVSERLYNVDTIFGIPATWAAEALYYPTNVEQMGKLPLLVIGHGAGHNYTWYGHIGYHMASYGFVVMSHANNFSQDLATCRHTDAFLELLPSIAGGVLVGHIDTHHIIWCGHSVGGTGVTEGCYSITADPPLYVPTHYAPADIVLVDAMLPPDTHGTLVTNPGAFNYHLWTASGDGDVSYGTFRLHDRATRFRQSTVVQGAGHAWFHDAGGAPWFEGPCPIYEEGTHLVQLGLMLPMYKYYAQGNVAGEDFLWRQYEAFHPPAVPVGIDPCYVVSQEYRNHAEGGFAFLDDYETHTETDVSSSGGAVTFDVDNLTEGRLRDSVSGFAWTASDPFNGATQDGPDDTGKGVVFDWDGADRYCEWAVIPELQDFSAWKYLSLRGAQGTQHPYTLATDGVLTFTVTLRDSAGNISSISSGAYGGGFGMPYARSGGWHNEMRRIRIRTVDFLANGSPLNLSSIAAVRLDVGPSWGTPQGRIVLDELMLDNDWPAATTPLTMAMVEQPPAFVPPYVPTDLYVEIYENDDLLLPGSAHMYFRQAGSTWESVQMEYVTGELWRGRLPAFECREEREYYFSAEGQEAGVLSIPVAGAEGPFVSIGGTFVEILADDFEDDLGWTVDSAPDMTSGMWQRALPGGGEEHSPAQDYDGSGRCYLTDNRWMYDVDGGPTQLTSPLLDLSAAEDPVLGFAAWLFCNDTAPPEEDFLDVLLSSDDGQSWLQAARIASHDGWAVYQVHFADHIPLTASVRARFVVEDLPNNSQTEAGVDAVEAFDVRCGQGTRGVLSGRTDDAVLPISSARDIQAADRGEAAHKYRRAALSQL
jgi:hypothetical protein